MRLNYIFFIICLLFSVFATAQEKLDSIPEKKKKESMLSMMAYKEIIPVTIKADIAELIEEKFDQKERTGYFHFLDSLGQNVTLPIRLKTRGKTRLIRCDVPPVMLYFDKPALKEQRIKDYPKFKVVVPCFQDSLAEDLLYRELLAYKLYALVSDFHFRVQAAELTCVNKNAQDTTHVLSVFFIESDKEFRKRTETEELSQYNILWSDLDPEQAQITALFQYMIGNADWKIDHKHNLKYFRDDEEAPLVIVPYDFDFSGLVNAPYAKPNPDYQQDSVRQRIYLGEKNKYLASTVQLFIRKEAEIMIAVADDPHLSAESKADIKSFLALFFKTLKSRRERRKVFK